jgi:bifunctional UDP-N-acetylglucosamine pyrophosphorylase/glucosamine-1-phosphate N-acetyltransferase
MAEPSTSLSPARGQPPLVAVVLAAGKGTRLRSERPKVMHEVAGRPMLARVLATARAAGCSRLLVIVGHGAEAVREAFAGEEITWVEQREQRGTGDALAQVERHLDGPARLLVLSGDVPLIRPATLQAVAAAAVGSWGSLAVARLDRPGSLGRAVVEHGRLWSIVEAANATPEQLALQTINVGLYLLPAPAIFGYLSRLEPDPVKGEYYLTEALNRAAAEHDLAARELTDPDEALGINSQQDLAVAHRALLDRHGGDLQRAGVTLLDPARISVEPEVEVGADTVLHADVWLGGRTRVGSGCRLHQGAWIRDSRLGDGVEVAPYSVLDGAEVGDGCRVGPYARLRPGARLEAGARVGNFVEVKNARLGPGVKAGHLAYLGDADVGAGTNIGAGAVTCNYDGTAKHRTTIGERAFIGSDTMLVAPVEVGDEAVTGAGSVITNDVPAEALAVERSRQRNVAGWSRRRGRGGKKRE